MSSFNERLKRKVVPRITGSTSKVPLYKVPSKNFQSQLRDFTGVSLYLSNFDEAVKIVTQPLVDPLDNEILVKNIYVGVNATDLNITAGRYFAHEEPPYSLGIGV
jgi:hypothetical protein